MNAEIVPIIQESKQNQFIVQYDGTFNQIAKLITIEMTAINLTHVEAAKVIAKRTRNQEQLLLLQEWDVRLWRHLGQFLREMPSAAGRPKKISTPKVEIKLKQTIAGLGVNYNESSRAQQWARMPEQEFEATVIAPIKNKITKTIIIPVRSEKRQRQDTIDKLEKHLETLANAFYNAAGAYIHVKEDMVALGTLSPEDDSIFIKRLFNKLSNSIRSLEELLNALNVKEHILQLGKEEGNVR